MSKRKPLTYEDLAEIHDKNECGKARTKPLDYITDWAKTRPGLIAYDPDKDLFYVAING